MNSQQHPRSDSPAAAVTRFLERVDAVSHLNVFASLAPADSLHEQAAASTARWRSGRALSPLDGVLVSVKDNVARQGEPCRLGSAARPDRPETKDAPAMAKMLAAGLIVVGRTTMPDHGCKATTHGGLHGTTRNPWDATLTSGGSSGGAAASVGAGLTRVALGSDGGGSIRIPAAFCGVVGLKPTHGRVPVVPGGPFDEIGHQGPIGATVAEVAALLDIVSAPASAPVAPVLPGLDLTGLRFTVWDDDTTDPSIAAGVRRTVEELVGRGAVEVHRGLDLADARRAWETLFCAGAAAAVDALADPTPIDPVLAELARAGRSLSPDDRARGEAAGQAFRLSAQSLFSEVDLVVSPVTSCLPFPVGQEAPPGRGMKFFQEWAPWAYPFNVTGDPALALPTGLSDSGLPTAVQLVARRGRDGLLLRVAAELERALGALPPSPAA